MRKVILTFVTIIAFGVSVHAQLGTRVISSISSICPPLNWKNSINMVFNGPEEKGNNAIIKTRMEIMAKGRSVKTLKEYVDIEVSLLGNSLISRTSFRTNSGIVGEKVVFKTTTGIFSTTNTILKVQYFFFEEKQINNCIIITCSVLENKASKYLSLFDGSVKTFEHVKK